METLTLHFSKFQDDITLTALTTPAYTLITDHESLSVLLDVRGKLSGAEAAELGLHLRAADMALAETVRRQGKRALTEEEANADPMAALSLFAQGEVA